MILFIVSFIAGVLTVLAPCILPLLPIILGGAVADSTNKRRPIVIIIALSLSLFIFTLLLKGSTALIDVSPSFWTYVSAFILAVFGFSLLFPETWARLIIKIPGHNKPDLWLSKGSLSDKSFAGDIIIGASLGPVFTTCSPTFFVILATVLPQSFAMGVIDLLAYIIGLALSLALIAYLGQKLVGHLGWASDPKSWFRKGLGVLFILLALSIAFGWDKKAETYILQKGFFDVTTLEQSIHRSLEGDTSDKKSALPVFEDKDSESTSTPVSAKVSNENAAKDGNYIEIVNPSGFVNSAPFKLSDIVGRKVIVLDFIDYSCINCERTFPYLNDWYRKYKDQGLEIVAIHTPEFSFEKDIKNVRAAAEQFGLKFPIVLDNNYSTWNAYGNRYWPHKYFIDIHGNVIYDHIGEGDDDTLEKIIVSLLNERKKVLGDDGSVISVKDQMQKYTIQSNSPETYFGSMRNELFGNGQTGKIYTDVFSLPSKIEQNKFYLSGNWHIEDEYAENLSSDAGVSYSFNAMGLYLVASSRDGKPVQARIMIDGKPISKDISGEDIKDGILTITSSRLYRIFKGNQAGQHRIDIIIENSGVRLFTFTFG